MTGVIITIYTEENQDPEVMPHLSKLEVSAFSFLIARMGLLLMHGSNNFLKTGLLTH